jgi:hypothetical protein
MHMHQQTHGGVFYRSRSSSHRNGQQAMSDIGPAVLRKTLLQHARLALITHLFTFLSLLCLDPASSATSVILSALKVATSIYEHGVKAERTERRSHHD